MYTFDDIAQDTTIFCEEDSPLIFLGDLNARTGNIPDNLDISNQEDELFRINPSQFTPRQNADTVDNSRCFLS